MKQYNSLNGFHMHIFIYKLTTKIEKNNLKENHDIIVGILLSNINELFINKKKTGKMFYAMEYKLK